jgi:streptomycin 6-kinase
VASILSQTARRTLLNKRLGTHGDDGAAWVERLPAIVTSVAQAWALTLEPHFEGLSYNYVAPVRRADGTPAVLKVCYPDPGGDFRYEEQALRAFGGDGCVRLLASDFDHCVLLLEALRPGLPASSLCDDVAEVSATASVIRTLHRPPPEGYDFPAIAAWIEAMAQQAAALADKPSWLDRGIALGRELLAAPAAAVLLHGDLHHDNILSSGDGWRCIDPKGVVGEPAWEIGPYLYNHLADEDRESSWRRTVRRRADQFADQLGLDRHRLYACAAVYALLSCSWSLEEGDDLDGAWFAQRRAVMRELEGF